MNILNIKKNFSLLLAAGLLVSVTSCNKFLKEESQDEVIPETATDYAELLLGSGYPRTDEPFDFLYLMDDDVEFAMDFQAAGSIAALEQYPRFTWQPSMVDRNGQGEIISVNPGDTPYAKYYTSIMGCNAVLDNIDNSIGTDAQKQKVRAEALAVRAYYYFQLANYYGEPYFKNPEGLAVPLKLTSALEETYRARNTVKEVYAQVINDLNEASELMHNLPIVRGDFHINLPAIHILLSRVYLFMEDWDNTIKEANKVFELGGKIAALPEIPRIPGQEAPASTYLTYDNPEVEWVFGGNTQVVQNPYIPNRSFIATFSDKDARKSYFAPATSSLGVYHLLAKLPTGTSFAQVLRSSEALLNRAEAYARKGEVSSATTDLNLLRANRIAEYTNQSFSSADETLTAIRQERRKEFCYEGFRWLDLRRYGMPAIEHVYQNAIGEAPVTYRLEENDPMYTLPFENSLIQKNPELKQNPSADAGDRVGISND